MTTKKKLPDLDIEKKHIEEQKYAEQDFHLVDPTNEMQEVEDEKGIAEKKEEGEGKNKQEE